MSHKDSWLPSITRQRFFDKTVYHPNWQSSMASKNEEPVMKVLNGLGYKLKEHCQRQFPIGERFVLDSAFPKLRLAIEVDGMSHQYKAQKKLDKMRDTFLYQNGWVVIRVNNDDFFDTYKHSFFKNLIKEVVDEREKQYQEGELYHIDINRFIQEDYEDYR